MATTGKNRQQIKVNDIDKIYYDLPFEIPIIYLNVNVKDNLEIEFLYRFSMMLMEFSRNKISHNEQLEIIKKLSVALLYSEDTGKFAFGYLDNYHCNCSNIRQPVPYAYVETLNNYFKRNINKHLDSKFTPQKEIEPIRLNLGQRQIIYLFQTLINEGMLNETLNPKVWHLVSQYFTDKDGNQLNNIHQNKDGLQNTNTGKPKKLASEIQTIINKVKNSLE